MTIEQEKKYREEFEKDYPDLKHDKDFNFFLERDEYRYRGYIAGRKKGEEKFDKLSKYCGEVEQKAQYHELTKISRDQMQKEIAQLKAELDQQKFNNKHNLSIDQAVSDEIVRLREQLKRVREDHEQEILWLKSGNVQLDDLIADIERRRAQRRVEIKRLAKLKREEELALKKEVARLKEELKREVECVDFCFNGAIMGHLDNFKLIEERAREVQGLRRCP